MHGMTMHSDVAVRVDGLGKKYQIGAAREPYATLRDQIGKLGGAARGAGRRLLRRGRPAGDPTEFWALRDVSFEVGRGEVVGVIGRNGAGKSTLLKILSRITEPTEGGADVRGRVGSLLEVGTGFNPELTGRENVFLNGAILGMTRAEIRRKFDEIVAFAEVEKFLDTPVKRYSSGMYVRLAFAVAAHLEPEVLVVDEVLAVGDAEFQKKCLGKMGEVAQGGRTVLFVSHNMSAVRGLCGRVVLLKGGTVSATGEPDRIISRYLTDGAGTNRFVRDEGDAAAGIRFRSAEVRVSYAGDVPALETEAVVQSDRSTSISLDIELLDAAELPIGFAPVGSFNQHEEIRLAPGATRISARHSLDCLATGSYTATLGLADPGMGYHDRVQGAVRFDFTPPPREGCYRRLEQAWGYGCNEYQCLSRRSEPLGEL